MASVNKVILVGNLGRDPETRYMPDGGAITNISLATTRKFKAKDGTTTEETEWSRVVFFGKLAEIAGEYLKKGASVYVEGRLRTREWQDKDGAKKYTTEIVADQMQMLGGKGEKREESEPMDLSKPKNAAPPKAKDGGVFDDMDDDIPF